MSKALDRLGKILALADSGATDEERDAALAKAEEMAAVLGVELAVARAHHADRSKREEPVKRRVTVGNERSRYNAYMVELFCVVADPHDVAVTVGWRNLNVTCYGLPSDIDIVEALFAVAAVRMVTDADKAIRRGAQKTAGPWGSAVDGRAYRAHFYRGYRSQLLSRLYESRAAAIRSSAGTAEARTGTEMVLRDKAAEVRDFYEGQTKHLRVGTWKPPQRDDTVAAATCAGAASAVNTDLELSTKIDASSRSALKCSAQ